MLDRADPGVDGPADGVSRICMGHEVGDCVARFLYCR